MTSRPYPQNTYHESVIDPSSFYGKLRAIYSDKVIKTQHDKLKEMGALKAFDLKWQPGYDIRRLHGAKARPDGLPISFGWDSDIGKWIEGVCYFLNSPDGAKSTHAAELKSAMDHVIGLIEKAQQPDGYLNIYFTVVDPAGRFQNLRDLHELYNAGHLLEGAIAHYEYSGSRKFLNVMIRYLDLLMKTFGPDPGQMHGYPGHPELEFAVLRLHAISKDPRHLEFGQYLLSERGVRRKEQGDEPYFVWEAKEKRHDPIFPSHNASLEDVEYYSAHKPLHAQDEILGHSVRTFYLLAAAADLGGAFTDDARRLWDDCVDHKMYVTGGVGTEPKSEGFSKIKHWLPQSTAEGGCYAETCAAIACMMTSERLLSHQLDGKVREVLERCLLNAVLGGGSLNGKQFSYANKHATSGNETSFRSDWFQTCCCPPNLSRTLGLLGGYTWFARTDGSTKTIDLAIHLFVAATRTIKLPDGGSATISMKSEMPWKGVTRIVTKAPEGWKWSIKVPQPHYAANYKVSAPSKVAEPGYVSVDVTQHPLFDITFDLPVRVLASHPASGQDTLTVSRGPIIYTAESVDNMSLDKAYKHFEGLGITSAVKFSESSVEVEGITTIALTTGKDVYGLETVKDDEPYRLIDSGKPTRKWKKLDEKLVFVPWMVRSNRGGEGHLRTSFLRADEALKQ